MTQAIKAGDTIRMDYTGRLENGEVFDSSVGRQPLEFTVGQGQLIPGIEKAVLGMQTGERKTVTLSPEEAYGPRRDDLIVEVPLSKIPPDLNPEEGMQLQMTDQQGGTIPAVIFEVLDDSIRIDINHPLAGKTLIFDMQIV